MFFRRRPTVVVEDMSEASRGPDFGALRRSLLTTVKEVNATTEREVLSAGASVTSIVDGARAHIEWMKSTLLQMSSRGSEGSLAEAISGQGQLVRRHVDAMQSDLEHHQERTRTASAHVATIATAARTIASLAVQARILSINARIEAAHVRDGATGFATVAQEMRKLSDAIAAANENIQGLAGNLAEVIPAMAREAAQITERTREFAVSAEASIATIDRRVGELEAMTTETLSGGDRILAQIVRDSHEALSHLQFQDVCSQRLLGIDREVRTFEVAHFSAAGNSAALAEIEPEAHHELGGGSGSAGRASGEVLLF